MGWGGRWWRCTGIWTVGVELVGDHLLPVTAADELAGTVREFLKSL